ncbi:MAG TPA: hypothetical protein VM580_00855 [Labilithrix sp.]|nr:hypothetical protein [Labilithrix sp.]
MPRRIRRIVSGSVLLALATTAGLANAATWARGRTTPTLRELVAIDATAETSWPYGQEDVAGDGLATFAPSEQSIDVRTGYATTDATNFWVRAYVSEPSVVGSATTVFVFIDSDANANTGGPATSPDINTLLSSDPSPGGYEFCIGIRGNGVIDGIWAYRQPQAVWEAVPPGQQGERQGEAGSDFDPIRIADDTHGYVQARVHLATIGLGPACAANLFIRSVNTAPGLGNGDLDVGKAGACVPVDTNGDRIPDVLVPPTGCTRDEQCPDRGVCHDGRCIIAAPCETNAHCAPGYVCTADGRCVPQGGNACRTRDACDGLACVNGVCGACTPGGTDCGANRRCAPDGRCIAGGGPSDNPGGANGDGGVSLAPGEKVVGGAFNCSAGGAGAAELSVASSLAIAFVGWIQRRAKRKERRS